MRSLLIALWSPGGIKVQDDHLSAILRERYRFPAIILQCEVGDLLTYNIDLRSGRTSYRYREGE